jgi:hypothetical protein
MIMKQISLLCLLLLCISCQNEPPVKHPDNNFNIRLLVLHFKGAREHDQVSNIVSQLKDYGEEAVPYLVEALTDIDPCTRKWAARSLSDIGQQNAKEGGKALVRALNVEKDKEVIWYIVQAVGVVRPDPDIAIPALVKTLEHPVLDIKRMAVEAIGQYGADAKSAMPALIKVMEMPDEWLQMWTVQAMKAIGLDSQALWGFVEGNVPYTPEGGMRIFLELLSTPDLALIFFEKHTNLLVAMARKPKPLMELLDRTDGRYSSLKEAILKQDDLPPVFMAWTLDHRYLPKLKSTIETADPYRQIFLKACARACGDPPDRVVNINEIEAGGFKPLSAMGVDNRRKSEHLYGHGDGAVFVLVTGRLLMKDGSPVVEPKFTYDKEQRSIGKFADHMFKYAPKTGRFVYYTCVGAAFDMSDDPKKEPGPYQTGCSVTQIEAKNTKPLLVQFYDEMPDVLITMTPTDK